MSVVVDHSRARGPLPPSLGHRPLARGDREPPLRGLRDADGRFTSFDVVQTAPTDHPLVRPHRLAVGLYSHSDGGLVRTRQVELDVVGDRTEVPALVGEEQPDLVLVNDGDLTYGKVRLDQRSAATLVSSIDELADPLARALCWSAAWDMTRDAEMTAGDFVTLVSRGIARETDIGVLQAIIRQAASATYLYTPRSLRADRLAQLAGTLADLARSAAPGSDPQLALVRAAASLASTDEQLAFIGSLLDGTQVLPGLAVDTDLRWSLLQRLVAMGRRGDEAIDAELTRDATATGRRQAALARALRPTAEAKEEAWHAAVETDELPNALLSATVAGFSSPDHVELTRAFVRRYFDALEQIWSTRTNEIAQSLVVGLYPVSLVEQETVDATRAYLDGRDVAPALRRLLVEAADGVERALRVQAQEA